MANIGVRLWSEPALGDVSASAVETHLEKILSSEIFRTTPRLSRFLNFVVRRTIESSGEILKEFVIGTEVFGRDRTFDPRLDSIVRVEAGRLRARLERYYASEGRRDTVRIELPKGTYVPSFVAGRAAPAPSRPSVSWPAARRVSSIAVLPFVNIGDDPANDYISEGFSEEVIDRLPASRDCASSPVRPLSAADRGLTIPLKRVAH